MAQPYDQYMAEHGLQSTLDEQRRNFTYEAAKGKYESGGGVAGQSSGGGGGGGASYDEILKAAIKAQQEANQPAVSSLEASKPTTQKLFEQQGQYLQSQVQPMEQRYQSLLNSIKGQQTTDVNKQTLVTNNELGKRGITGSSGLAQQEIQSATEPINQYYTGQYASTGSDREAAIAALNQQITQNPMQEQQALDQINNAIAQLQSGGNQAAITGALSQYQTQQNSLYQQQQNNLAQQAANQSAELQPYQIKSADLANQTAQAALNNLLKGKTTTANNNPYATVSNAGNWA